jgi:hypothetical protein
MPLLLLSRASNGARRNCPEVVIDRALRAQVGDDDQDGVGHRDGRLGPPATGRQPPVLRRHVRPFGPRCGVGGLAQTNPQLGTPLACGAPVTVAATLVIPWTAASPGRQVSRWGS